MAEAGTADDGTGGRRLNPPTAVIKAVRSLVEMPAGPGPRVWIAVRAALSIGAPFGVLTALGHEDIGLQTAAGAFVALFAADRSAAERGKVLPFVALALLACCGLGVLLAPWPLAVALGLVAVAAVTGLLAFAFRLGPPGPVFFVLSYGLAANITMVVDGARLHPPLVLLAAVAGGALFSILVALAPLLRAVERAKPVRPLGELLPGPWIGPQERELLLRILIVAVLGTVVTVLWIDPHRAYWTVSTGVAVIGLSAVRRHSLARGLHRTVGTLVGAVLFLVISPLGAQPAALVLMLVVLQFCIELVVVRNYALALVFITPLVLLISGAATGGDLVATAGERVLDTIIGSAIAVATALIHRRTRRGS
ncbi:FUSC family protein [Leucobacter allii]|uniref:FUSC family protein n=1 Tax=Leucobacter allii TaxID=2932247 RepID=UPI001FD1BD84|nr:FUSC family protein [Leucobacter allii]UOR01182.1 FUSC family protein [Leucobacter allii]